MAYAVAIAQDEAGKRRLNCKVRVGEREIVNVGDGLSRMEVETRAADEACKVLRREGRKLGKGRGQTMDVEMEDEGGGEEEEEGEEEEGQEDDEGKGSEQSLEDNFGRGGNGRKRKIDDYEDQDADDVNDSDDNRDSPDEDYVSAEE